MSYDFKPKLEEALKILKDAGHQIGDPPRYEDAMHIWIDGVSCTFEDVIGMAEEEIKESEQPG